MKTKEYREQLAESFLHVLEEKQLDWKKEWQGFGGQAPVNGSSGRCYKGINRFYLALVAMNRGYQDHRWCTFNQIKDKGWKLVDAKGQGIKVEYWFPYDTEKKKSISWEEFRQSDSEFGERYVLRAVYKTVFNADLIEGIPALPEPELKDISSDILIRRLSANMGVDILDDGGDRAFYSPVEDKIHLPLQEYFNTDYAYNSTALHELAHATGAAHRLNRNLSGTFGTLEYAYEELIAEISSCFMSANLQLEQSKEHIENHKAYVQSWVQSIREKPETLVRAVQQAEKTASYMEYKAELISREEYEVINNVSMDVQETALEESYQNRQDTVMALNGSDIAWYVSEEGTEQVLYYFQEEVLRGSIEDIRSAEERIQYARENANIAGEALRKVRTEQGYTRDQMAQIGLVSEKELQLIEEGQIYPDRMTLQIISNVCTVYSESLENGQIVPKKSNRELGRAIQEIRDKLDEIRSDTRVLRAFAEKYGIPIPDKMAGQKEYYVVEDQKTGEMLADVNGEEIRMENREDAERLAEMMNDEEKALPIAEEVVRKYERSIGRTDSVLDKYSGEQIITYAAMCQKYLEFGMEVDNCLNNITPRREAVKVCETPELFLRAGCHEYPMHITQKHLRACMRKMEPGNMHYHGLTIEEIKCLPEALENPAVIADSLTRHDSVVAILGYREEANGFPVIVSIVPDGKATYSLEKVDLNFITSIYGRENSVQFVKRLMEQGKLIYMDKEKSQELALVPLQLRQGHPAPDFNVIIKRIGEDVNPNVKNHRESAIDAEKANPKTEAEKAGLKQLELKEEKTYAKAI